MTTAVVAIVSRPAGVRRVPAVPDRPRPGTEPEALDRLALRELARQQRAERDRAGRERLRQEPGRPRSVDEAGGELGDRMSRGQVLGDQVAHASRALRRQRHRGSSTRSSSVSTRSAIRRARSVSTNRLPPASQPAARRQPSQPQVSAGQPQEQGRADQQHVQRRAQQVEARWPSGAAAASHASRNGAPRSRGRGRGRQRRRTARHPPQGEVGPAPASHRSPACIMPSRLRRRPPLREWALVASRLANL